MCSFLFSALYVYADYFLTKGLFEKKTYFSIMFIAKKVGK